MKQAYQHLTEGTTYYQHITDQISKLINTWNDTHTKQVDPDAIVNIYKTIFKYHHWIKVEDIEPSIDLGLMGEFGENKGLNTETIFNWFKGHSKNEKSNELKTHSAYQTESTYISMEQRKETRASLIQTFMNFYGDYIKTRVYNPEMNHYLPVFYRWFKKLGYIDVSESYEERILNEEVLRLRDLRSFLSKKNVDTPTKTMKIIFMESFNICADNEFPLEEQLKEMNI